MNKRTLWSIVTAMIVGGVTFIIQIPSQKMAEKAMIDSLAKNPNLAAGVAEEMKKQEQIEQKTE